MKALTKEFTIFRNEEKVGLGEVLGRFRKSLESNTETYKENDIDMLVTLYAKNPVDKFIVSNFPTVEVAQGDILIWAKGTNMYNENLPKLQDLHETKNLVLQPNDSMTGDHKIIPMKDSEIKIMEGYFVPELLEKAHADIESRKRVRGLIVTSSKPFLIFHREHGNVALPAGEYMVCSQLDPRSLTTMLD